MKSNRRLDISDGFVRSVALADDASRETERVGNEAIFGLLDDDLETMESTPVILLLLNVAVVPGGQQGLPKRIGAVFLESRTPVKRSFLWGWHDPRIRDFPERVTRLFSGSRDTDFSGVFAGKRCPDRLVAHAVRGRAAARSGRQPTARRTSGARSHGPQNESRWMCECIRTVRRAQLTPQATTAPTPAASLGGNPQTARSVENRPHQPRRVKNARAHMHAFDDRARPCSPPSPRFRHRQE